MRTSEPLVRPQGDDQSLLSVAPVNFGTTPIGTRALRWSTGPAVLADGAKNFRSPANQQRVNFA